MPDTETRGSSTQRPVPPAVHGDGGLRTYTLDELNDELKIVNISTVGLTRFQKYRIVQEIAERAQRAQRVQRA